MSLLVVLAAVCLGGTAQADMLTVGSGNSSAGVYLEFSDGAAYEFEVLFDDSTTGISLWDVIEANTSLTIDEAGGFIDGISYEGHSNSGYGGGEDWWHYWIMEPADTDWTFSMCGASDRVVTDGAWDGWIYGRAGAPLPEPTSLALIGLGSIAILRRKRR